MTFEEAVEIARAQNVAIQGERTALRKLIATVDASIEWMDDGHDTRAWLALKNAVAEAKEALK